MVTIQGWLLWYDDSPGMVTVVGIEIIIGMAPVMEWQHLWDGDQMVLI